MYTPVDNDHKPFMKTVFGNLNLRYSLYLAHMLQLAQPKVIVEIYFVHKHTLITGVGRQRHGKNQKLPEF